MSGSLDEVPESEWDVLKKYKGVWSALIDNCPSDESWKSDPRMIHILRILTRFDECKRWEDVPTLVQSEPMFIPNPTHRCHKSWSNDFIEWMNCHCLDGLLSGVYHAHGASTQRRMMIVPKDRNGELIKDSQHPLFQAAAFKIDFVYKVIESGEWEAIQYIHRRGLNFADFHELTKFIPSTNVALEIMKYVPREHFASPEDLVKSCTSVKELQILFDTNLASLEYIQHLDTECFTQAEFSQLLDLGYPPASRAMIEAVFENYYPLLSKRLIELGAFKSRARVLRQKEGVLKRSIQFLLDHGVDPLVLPIFMIHPNERNSTVLWFAHQPYRDADADYADRLRAIVSR